MKGLKIIRKIFQTLAVILFIIQLIQSVNKYFEYPVVVQTSQVEFIPDRRWSGCFSINTKDNIDV